MSAPKRRIASASIDPELDRRIDRLAESMGITRSKMLEKIIRNGVAEMEHVSKVIGTPGLNALFRLGLAFENEEDAEEIRHILNSLRDHRRRRSEPPLPFGTAEAV